MKRILPVLTLCTLSAVMLTGCGPFSENERLYQINPADDVKLTEPYEIIPNETETAERTTEPPAGVNVVPRDFDSITDQEVMERLRSQRSNADYIPDWTYSGNCDLQNFREAGNDYAYYDGGLDEASVLENFDILANDQKLLARWFVDDPEIKCIAYDFYAVEDNGDGTAELGWYCYLIDREDHMVHLVPEWNQKRTISLTEAPEPQDAVFDIELTLEKREILIGQDDPQLVIRAVPPASCNPASVQLIDADTDTFICDLVDDCNFEAHGDDIQGDGWYCNRWTAPTDFGTDPDVSEEKTFRFYAQFERDGVLHRSETAELTVFEQWTDKELDDRQEVDDAINELMQTDEWKQANTETRASLARACLALLAEKGLVDPNSIGSNAEMVTWSYTSGGTGGIQLKPFDPMMN